MDFSFSEEQQLLRNSLNAFLVDRYPFSKRQKLSNSEAGWDRDIWASFAKELGILAMPFPERVGGMGCNAIDSLVVMEELGRALVIEPYWETVILCGGLLKKCQGSRADELMGRIGSGQCIAALAWADPESRFNANRVATRATKTAGGWVLNGAKSMVTAAPWADGFIVSARTAGSEAETAGISLFWVDAQSLGLDINSYPTIDGRRAADLTLRAVSVPADALLGEVDQGSALLQCTLDEGVTALCAESLGVIGKMHTDTVEYTKQRKQFGQSISTFQVLQHRMVDMYMECEMARSATYLAALKLTDVEQERTKAVSAAKVTSGEACRMVGQNAVQLHGGMGMTDELAVSHYFRRATVIEAELGSVDFHLSRYASLTR